ncbi:alginate lyase family protein [Parapedobacter tibetensis]|uniref:alginate lyase family protein n=1 Tax=Parapedobacter tibetensis TaxID=2972951 RepID=UPI00214DEC45|nr:alginate lyase family protein [Parapedobacter tibetensis]
MKRLTIHTTVSLMMGCLLYAAACSKGTVNNIDPGIDTTSNQGVMQYIDTLSPTTPIKHVGGLHTAEDFARIKTKINAGAEPWVSGWNKLTANSRAQLSYMPNPVVKLVRGGNSREEPDPDNYSRAFNDVAAAYQLALRWKISGDDAYADKAVQILNAWAATCERISGDSNTALAGGIYGYQFALAGELLRDYEGWTAEDFAAYKQWMVDVFYTLNMAFLNTHWGTCDSHYWANWDLCNLASVMAIGILTDNRSMYNYAVHYLQQGRGNGNLTKAINHVFTGADTGLAQLQESGRDQGHSTLVIALLATICQLTWNQGDDFYGFDDNRFLKACEYTAKYNVARLSVPFHEYTRLWAANCSQVEIHTQISEQGRGSARPMWSAPYFHYTKVKGKTATYTGMGVQTTLPEGGGGDYGPNSGGFDQLGFGTLMFTLD